jgi:hypothetical protein
MMAMSPQVPAIAHEDARRSSWMAAAQCGDRVAYEALLRDCVIPIQRVARLKRVPADRIDDVVQETLLTVHDRPRERLSLPQYLAATSHDYGRYSLPALGTMSERAPCPVHPPMSARGGGCVPHTWHAHRRRKEQ